MRSRLQGLNYSHLFGSPGNISGVAFSICSVFLYLHVLWLCVFVISCALSANVLFTLSFKLFSLAKTFALHTYNSRRCHHLDLHRKGHQAIIQISEYKVRHFFSQTKSEFPKVRWQQRLTAFLKKEKCFLNKWIIFSPLWTGFWLWLMCVCVSGRCRRCKELNGDREEMLLIYWTCFRGFFMKDLIRMCMKHTLRKHVKKSSDWMTYISGKRDYSVL